MNILEEIQNCPVEWKELGEVCKIETGKLNATESVEDGKYPFFTTAKEISRINSFRWNTEALLIAGNANVGDVKYYSGRFEAYQRTYVLTNFSHNVKARFLLHIIKQGLKYYLENNTNKAAMSYIVISTLKSFPIPIPPLEIQEKIVQILDKFTDYVTELTSELTSRKKQYSFYRDKLLSFEDEVYQVEWKTLGDIGKVSMCRRILKNQTSDDGEVPFYKIGTFGRVATSYISRELFEDYKLRFSYPKLGDVLISASGTIGRTVVFNGEDSYFQDSNIVWLDHDESQVLNRYLYYFYQMNPWKVSDGGTISRLYNGNIEKTRIPVPSLEIQSRIVQVLDNFDTVCNDLNIGLPKEIELRQKQYEYFREKLLTFVAEGVYPDSGQWHGHNLT
ncbi:type I restriction-modification system S protein [Streptococcus milleri]|uniref:Type I restriction-modification system S protein n=1 Tax=Streptococcus milleri TaxID=33040 RepID=A0A380L451_9STRE|nr:restriction endonuclease subunit S [Streptococcus milleri]SUN79860.1 type I restriction-modification system S protein [Streptococcus milleri]